MGVVGDGGGSPPDFSFIPRLKFFNGSCLRWSFGWKFFSSNTTRMSVRTLHYRSDPQGRSWWRFLYSKHRLLFNFKCWLFFQGWDTCEIEINKWITHFLWNYYIWLQFFFQHYNNSYTHQNIKYPSLLGPFACNLRCIGKK